MPADPEADSKLQIANVLYLDVVGYSKLLVDAQTELMAGLTRIVRNTTRLAVAEAARKLVRLPTDDGMALVFFDDPEAAMECAKEISVALKSHPEIKLRIGIHSGPVNRVVDVNEQANVAGAGIDIAQRVMSCGDAGHILLSRRVAYDLAPLSRWNAHLYELGDCEVKHGEKISLVNFYTDEIGNPELPTKLKRAREEALARARRQVWLRRAGIAAVFLLMLAGLAGTLILHRRITAPIVVPPPPPPEKSIAVMPFVDLSQARDQEYFCDGISEEILDALAKVEGLRVVARTSSFFFKGKNPEASEIGRKLNVATVLEGSLRRDKNRIRISVQLINARDGFHIWSETIEKEMAGVLATQGEITRKIVDALKIKLAVVPAPHPQQNTEAYDLYLQGLFFSNKSSEQDIRKSLDLFERALAKDPKLGRAWTGTAKAWLWLADTYYVRPLDAYPHAQEAALKALALDERDAEAHAYLGETKRILSYDLKGEEVELKRALEIDPNSALAHLFLAGFHFNVGDPAEGFPHLQTAVRLDPLSPVAASWQVQANVQNNRFEEALAAAKRMLEIDPNYVYFEPELALVYREQGKLREALEIYLRLAQTTKRPSAGLALTYARLAKRDEARKVLRELIQIANKRYLPGEQIASVYVALGDHDNAIQWLDRAIKEHSAPIYSIASVRLFLPLRADPRFPDLLRRIGFDPAKFAPVNTKQDLKSTKP